MSFVITPQSPIADWLADLDASLERSKGFFAGHPIALDLSAVQLMPSEIAQLVAKLEERKIRVLGIEGVEVTDGAERLPPILRGGRGSQDIASPEADSGADKPVKRKQEPASLLVESPVRSGQSVVYIDGDVTILGSVGSGAEVIAGGSIHVYGTLRGQAMAGATGNPRARIFCHRFEAELLAIGAYYKTADEIDDGLRRGPVQAWLDNKTLRISAIN